MRARLADGASETRAVIERSCVPVSNSKRNLPIPSARKSTASRSGTRVLGKDRSRGSVRNSGSGPADIPTDMPLSRRKSANTEAEGFRKRDGGYDSREGAVQNGASKVHERVRQRTVEGGSVPDPKHASRPTGSRAANASPPQSTPMPTLGSKMQHDSEARRVGRAEGRARAARNERTRNERTGAPMKSSEAAAREPASASEPADVEDLAESAEIELPDDSSLAALENAKSEVESSRSAEDKASGDTMLSRYFRDMATHRVLRPEEEVEAAKTVEDLERKYWVALLAYPAALETVALVVDQAVTAHEQVVPPELAELRKLAAHGINQKLGKKAQEKWDALVWELACRLRELDGDRLYVEGSYVAVQRIAGRYLGERDLIGGEVQLTATFKRYVERVEKARRLQKQAKNRFVAANLRLVVSIARRYNRGRMPLIDLIQEGNLGLMKAVERFDHARGYRFSTYASWWIRHAISRALADKGRAVRIPVHMLDTFNRVQKATQALSSKTGHDPSTEDLAKETGIAEDKLEKMQGYWAETPFSLDRPVNDEDGRKFVDFLENENIASPHDTLVQQAWSDEVQRLLSTLSPMEARILRWRFGLDDEEELTLKEIGDKYNLSRERIRQLQEQALGKIRKQLRD
ncbi:MAG: polymerase sigma factor RpoD [Myxococcaceae bacterium]|nr:polymerase sigma factor RpoD [Myxococcaceae bacterium]